MKLIKYEAARAALAAAHRVDEVKALRDKAAALAAYARQARDTDMIAWATEIKVRAERRCGEMLRDTAQTGERATRNGNLKQGPKSHAATSGPTLADLNISRSQSARYQHLAAMPLEHFETAVATAKENVGEVTTAQMLRLASLLRTKDTLQTAFDGALHNSGIASDHAWLKVRDAMRDLRKKMNDPALTRPAPDSIIDELTQTLEELLASLSQHMETTQ